MAEPSGMELISIFGILVLFTIFYDIEAIRRRRPNHERNLLKTLAAAGIVGPVAFALVVAVHGWVRPDYSHMTMPVSALAAGPSGWIQNLNFIMLGSLLVAQSIGLHLGARPRRLGILGPGLLVLSGLAIVGVGIFPATDAAGNFAPGQPLHSGMSVLAFLTAGIGMIAFSRRVKLDREWDGWRVLVMTFGIGTLIMLILFGSLAVPPDSPLHNWLGLMQRVLIGVWLAGIMTISMRVFWIVGKKETGPAGG